MLMLILFVWNVAKATGFGQAIIDSKNISKMGPPGVKKGLEIHPFEGGIEGLYPLYGSIILGPSILFQWQGEKIKGEKPVLVLVNEQKNSTKRIHLQPTTQKIELSKQKLEVQPGGKYRWYLGNQIKDKVIAQSRVYFFEILSPSVVENFNQDVKEIKAIGVRSKDGLRFLKAQVCYKYNLYHDMLKELEPLYATYKTEGIKRLLFLGYVRIGRHAEAKQYE